jgi:hypothetical protein
MAKGKSPSLADSPADSPPASGQLHVDALCWAVCEGCRGGSRTALPGARAIPMPDRHAIARPMASGFVDKFKAYGIWCPNLQTLKIIAKGVLVDLKTVLRILIGLNITVALLGTLAWIDMHRFANNPGSTDPTQVIIEVAPGETFGTLCARLKHHGIVTSALRFKILARVKGDDKRVSRPASMACRPP